MRGTQYTVTARKRRRCDSGIGTYCTRWIEPGEDYLRSVAFPDGEVNQGSGPYAIHVCAGCSGEVGIAPRRRRKLRHS